MNKQQIRDLWLAKFTRLLESMSTQKMGPIENEIFKGAFELGWDAKENELLSDEIELDEFGRTDAQLELQIQEDQESGTMSFVD